MTFFLKHGITLGLILLSLSLVSMSPAHAASMAGKPVQVISGDQLLLQAVNGKRYQVRLAGISAPSTREPWGAAARRFLDGLVMGRTVQLVPGLRRGRSTLTGRLFHGGADINLRMIQAGLARYDPIGLTDAEAHEQYQAAQRQAMQRAQGFWRDGGNSSSSDSPSRPGVPSVRFRN